MSEKPSERPGADWLMAEAEKMRAGDLEIIPGMRAQAAGVEKVYVESDYAKLRSCYVGNPWAFHLPDIDAAWDMANMFASESEECRAYLRKYPSQFLGDADPERYAKVVEEQDALVKCYRENGVHVIRNENRGGPNNGYVEVPEEIVRFSESWSGGQKLVGLYAQAAWEVYGTVMVAGWEVSAEMAVGFQANEAVVQIMKDHPEATWLEIPMRMPTSWPTAGPQFSTGDVRIFSGKNVLFGIGVKDPSHIKDPTKARSSGDEFACHVLTKILEPYGWKVHPVYFDSNLTYHLDCFMAPLREGLLSYPKAHLFSPLPDFLKDWEVIDVSREDNDLGCTNNVAIGDNKVVVCEESKQYNEDMNKRGIEPLTVPYYHCFNIIGSGIHCSTAPIHRED